MNNSRETGRDAAANAEKGNIWVIDHDKYYSQQIATVCPKLLDRNVLEMPLSVGDASFGENPTPDLILLDRQLHGVGKKSNILLQDWLAAIKEHGLSSRCFLATSFRDKKSIELVEKHWLRGLLIKPLDIMRIEEWIAQADAAEAEAKSPILQPST